MVQTVVIEVDPRLTRLAYTSALLASTGQQSCGPNVVKSGHLTNTFQPVTMISSSDSDNILEAGGRKLE